MILWLTGQPGSGKTTLANEFIDYIKKDNPAIKIINIDGDDLRNISKNKDYSKEGRIRNISRWRTSSCKVFRKRFYRKWHHSIRSWTIQYHKQ